MSKNLNRTFKGSVGGTVEGHLVPLGISIAIVITAISLLIGFLSIRSPETPDAPQPSEKISSIELSAKDGYIAIPYDVKDMLPGDSATQEYCVSVTHEKAETVRFEINVDTAQKLSRVMQVKIEQVISEAEKKLLYDGRMHDCKAVDTEITAITETVTPIYYRITVYTNGKEVGNEYLGERLTADFLWQIH